MRAVQLIRIIQKAQVRGDITNSISGFVDASSDLWDTVGCVFKKHRVAKLFKLLGV